MTKYGIVEVHETPYGCLDVRIVSAGLLFDSRERAEQQLKDLHDIEGFPVFGKENFCVVEETRASQPNKSFAYRCGPIDEQPSNWEDWVTYEVCEVQC